MSFHETFGGFTDILGDIFGSVQETTGNVSSTTAARAEARVLGEDRERLEISDEAIDKIIRDVLGGADGLASIFAGEQNAGVFNTSVSAQAAGDLSANIIGEIAKLRAEKVRITDQTQVQVREGETTQRSQQQQEDGGLIGAIGNLFGF